MKNIAVIVAAALGLSSHPGISADTLPDAPLALDPSNTCQFLLTGSERYVFRATTTIMDGEPVFQGYDIDTCQPKKRFFYRFASQGVWNVDNDLGVSVHERAGYTTNGAHTGCPSVEMEVIRWGAESDKIKSFHGVPCWTLPAPAEAIPLHSTNDCLFAMTGYENYTLLPTTMIKNGEAVYQGYDNETCQAVDRHMLFTDQWNLDKDLEGSNHSDQGGRIGFINPTFHGCTDEANAYIWVPTYGHQNNSKIHRIESSPCFTPPTTTTPAPTTVPTTVITTMPTEPATTEGPIAPVVPPTEPSTEPADDADEQPPPAGTPTGVVVGAAAGGIALLGAGAYGATRMVGGAAAEPAMMDLEAQMDGDDVMDREHVADVGTEDFV